MSSFFCKNFYKKQFILIYEHIYTLSIIDNFIDICYTQCIQRKEI